MPFRFATFYGILNTAHCATEAGVMFEKCSCRKTVVYCRTIVVTSSGASGLELEDTTKEE